jgi:glucose-6-phosphate 1-dehydrogenase
LLSLAEPSKSVTYYDISFIVQLAVPPSQFTSLADKLHKNNYKGISNRLVIEKPFGKDSASAKEMMEAITKDGWKQEEIYRIDHFIGDEMVRAYSAILQDARILLMKDFAYK